MEVILTSTVNAFAQSTQHSSQEIERVVGGGGKQVVFSASATKNIRDHVPTITLYARLKRASHVAKI